MVNIFTVALSSFILLTTRTHAQTGYPPTEEERIPLVQVGKAHEDLYLYTSLPYGIWKVPMWIGVGSYNGAAGLEGASYMWKSGLKWFDSMNWSESNPIGGNFMSWDGADIDVTVVFKNRESVTLTGFLPRQEGCFTEYEKYIDDTEIWSGISWNFTRLEFDLLNQQLQTINYSVPGTRCIIRTWTKDYRFVCDAFFANLSYAPWPAHEDCAPANDYAASHIEFYQIIEGKAFLVLDGMMQPFHGTPVVPPTSAPAEAD